MIKLKSLLNEEVDRHVLEDLEGKDAIIQYLIANGKSPEVIDLAGDEYIIWDDFITGVDFVKLYTKEDWMNTTEAMRLRWELTDKIEEMFNNNFWKYPVELYHATQKENVDSIKIHGLKMQHKSRGLANRNIRAAVFTSTEPEWATHSYGPVEIAIDTKLMKQDRFTPFVTKEPNHTESDVYNFLAKKIKMSGEEKDYSNSSSEGTTDDTVIVYDNIPEKYLTIYD